MDMNPGTILVGLVFGSIGFVGFVYGKKESSWKPMVLGVALMGFPYFVPGFWPQIGVGAALTAALFFFRD